MEAEAIVQTLAGVSLVFIELARSVPAWRRVRHTRSSAGISPVSTGVLAGSALGWLAVAILANSIAAFVATLVWLTLHLMLWRELASVDPGKDRMVRRSAATTLSLVIIVAVVGIVVQQFTLFLGMAVAVVTIAYSFPALIAGLTSSSTEGLSAVSLAVNTIEGLIYLFAGVGIGGITTSGTVVVGYIVFGSGAVLSNLPRLVRVLWRRSHGKQ